MLGMHTLLLCSTAMDEQKIVCRQPLCLPECLLDVKALHQDRAIDVDRLYLVCLHKSSR